MPIIGYLQSFEKIDNLEFLGRPSQNAGIFTYKNV